MIQLSLYYTDRIAARGQTLAIQPAGAGGKDKEGNGGDDTRHNQEERLVTAYRSISGHEESQLCECHGSTKTERDALTRLHETEKGGAR